MDEFKLCADGGWNWPQIRRGGSHEIIPIGRDHLVERGAFRVADDDHAVRMIERIEGSIITPLARINQVIGVALLPNVKRSSRAEEIDSGSLDLRIENHGGSLEYGPILRIDDNPPCFDQRYCQLELPGQSRTVMNGAINDELGLAG